MVVQTRFGSGVAEGVTKEVTTSDGKKVTTLDNGQIQSDFSNMTTPDITQSNQPVTKPDGTVVTDLGNGQIESDFRNREEPTIEQPVVEQPVTPVSPTPQTPDTPIQTPEQKRTEEIAVQRDEANLKREEKGDMEAGKQEAIAGFQGLIESGANAQQLADFARANEDFKLDLAYVAKAAFKNKANAGFFNKYSGVSNADMYSAVKSGDIKIGSEKYNLLPEQQRQAFEEYKRIKEAPAGIPQTKEEVFNGEATENSVDFNNIESFISKMFSSDLKTKLDEARNDNRVTTLQQDLNAKASEIEKFDLTNIKAAKKLADDLANSGYIPAMVSATVADFTANKTIERMGMVSDYNRVQGDLASVKDDIEYDLELFKLEDAQEKEKYQTLFSIYESRRAEGIAADTKAEDRAFQREMTAEEREFAKEQTAAEVQAQRERDEFLAKNDEIAQDKQNAFTVDIKEFENEFAKEILGLNQDFDIDVLKQTQTFQRSMQQGDYIDDGNGNLVYVKDGKQVNVLSGLGTKVSSGTDGDWNFQTFENNDGTFTTVKTSKTTGAVEVVNNNITGDTAGGFFNTLGNGNITGYGGAYDKNQGLDIDGNVGDPVYSPFSGEIVSAQSSNGYGINVVLQDEATGEKIRFSHLDPSFLANAGTRVEKGAMIGALGNTGNVLKMDGTKPSAAELAAGFGSHLDIVSYDANGNARTSHETEAYLRGLGGEKAESTVGEKGFSENKAPLYAQFNAQKMSQTERLKYSDDEEFLNEALAYGKSKAEPGYAKIQAMIDLAEDIKGFGPIDRKLPDNSIDVDKLLGQSGMQELIDLKSQGATFGSLTEKEFQNIQNSVLNVGGFTSAEKWDEILTTYQNKLRAALPVGYETPTPAAPIVDATGLSTTSGFVYTPSAKIESSVDSFFNQ